MNSRLKLEELEAKAREMFGENFIDLAESCAIFNKGKALKENELGGFCSFSMNEQQLKVYAKDGFALLTIPKRITVEEICSLVPDLFIFNLNIRETISLKREIVSPGRYLVKKEPRHFSSGTMLMREEGMILEHNPRLAEVICAYALCHLAGKRKVLIERICILCREEVSRRYGKARLCFKKDPGSAINIGVWQSQISMPNVLPIKRA